MQDFWETESTQRRLCYTRDYVNATGNTVHHISVPAHWYYFVRPELQHPLIDFVLRLLEPSPVSPRILGPSPVQRTRLIT